jgi:hypothetical protein
MRQETDVPESRPPSVNLNEVNRLLSYESSQLPPRIRRPGWFTKAFSMLQKIPLIWHFKSRPNGNSGGRPRGRASIDPENRTGNVSHQASKSEP